MSQRRVDENKVLFSVRYAAVIFAPSHFVSKCGKVFAGDVVVNADFGATNAAEKAFRVICASAVIGIGFLKIYLLRTNAAVECVPMPRLVRVNR